MAASSVPSGDLTLHGIPGEVEDSKSAPRSAILLQLGEGVIEDLKKASNAKEGLRFVTGSAPVSCLHNQALGKSLTFTSEATDR